MILSFYLLLNSFASRLRISHMNSPPWIARVLKRSLSWMPKRLRGHVVKHIGVRILPAEFVAESATRGLLAFTRTQWDASRYYGLYEPEENFFFGSILKPGQIVVDVGANVGWYTAKFLHTVGQQGFVIAIEPDPVNISKLKRIAELNNVPSNFKIVECAVSDAPGNLTLYLNSDSGANTIVPQLGLSYGDRAAGTVNVEVQTLDSILSNTLRPDQSIDLLKIDVERAELAVLQGSQELLTKRRVKSIFIEVTDVSDSAQRNQASLIDAMLRSFGYTGREVTYRHGEGILSDKIYMPSKTVKEEGCWRNVYYQFT